MEMRNWKLDIRDGRGGGGDLEQGKEVGVLRCGNGEGGVDIVDIQEKMVLNRVSWERL